MVDKKIAFGEMLKELEFEQFIEVCRIFEIDILDKKVFKEHMSDDSAAEGNGIKGRRDFDVMMNEIVEKYEKENRKNRRTIYKLMERIVKANRAARRIISEKVTEQYVEGVNNLDKIVEMQRSDQ